MNLRHTILIRWAIVLPPLDGKLVEDIEWDDTDLMGSMRIPPNLIVCEKRLKIGH
jgi:hypothetical protein